VDTSVWSLALRRRQVSADPAAGKLRQLIEGEDTVLLTGIVLQELLQGLRAAKDAKMLAEQLAQFPFLEPSREDHRAAAELFNLCRRRGIQAGTVDVLIATLAMRGGCHLLTTDRDFAAIARVSPLRLMPV
jgi:predicted nucleic acid-binding protein